MASGRRGGRCEARGRGCWRSGRGDHISVFYYSTCAAAGAEATTRSGTSIATDAATHRPTMGGGESTRQSDSTLRWASRSFLRSSFLASCLESGKPDTSASYDQSRREQGIRAARGRRELAGENERVSNRRRRTRDCLINA